LYNVACCESLLGNIDSALAYLSRAINCGFRDVDHIMTDPDLVNLRDLDGFQVLLSEITSGTEISQNPERPYRLAQQKALGLMKCGKRSDIEKARELLLDQVTKYSRNEWQQRIPYYNLACCESILGNTQAALEYLEKAVACGYHNVKQLQSDPDLSLIRSHEIFQQCVSNLKSGHCARKENKKVPFDRKCERMGRNPHARRCYKNNCNPQLSPILVGGLQAEQQHQQQQQQKQLVVVENNSNIKRPEPITVEVTNNSRINVVDQQNQDDADEFKRKLTYLEQMGFLDRDKNVIALMQVSGNLTLAVKNLLGD